MKRLIKLTLILGVLAWVEQSVNTLQGAGKKTGETLKSIFQSLEKKKA